MTTSLSERPADAPTHGPPSPSDARQREPARVARLVRAAGSGDHQAWETLVRRFARLVRAIARRHRLPDADVADVVQTTWLRAVENLHRLHEPGRFPAWLATVARRESLRVLGDRARHLATDDDALAQVSDPARIDDALIAAERDAALWHAVGALTPRQRSLLEDLAHQPAASYEAIGATLGMPVGSIGPTRGRAFERLRRDPALAAVARHN